MPIYLDVDRTETRAITNRVMAAMERFLGRLLYGPRQHDADLRWSLGVVSSANLSESTAERS